jgi:hypothetical protein
LNVPDVVGVPETTPPLEREIPGGRLPEASAQEYGAVPPVAAKVVEYPTPWVPPAIDAVVIVSGATAVRVYCCDVVLDQEESRATKVNENEPAAPGFPMMVQVVPLLTTGFI